MEQIREQKFVLPQNSQSLPTFRQVGNYLNSISSASTIFFQRDNTHTRLQSQLKLNSNKPSLDLQMASNVAAKNESNILSYSQSSSLLIFQDSLMHLQKLITLFSSNHHLFNHISQSLALSGFNQESSKSMARIVVNSFSQYTQTALKVDFKALRQQMSINNRKIATLNHQLFTLKQENLKTFQKMIKLQNQNTKYRKKIVSVKQKAKRPQTSMLINMLKEQCNKVMNKMTNFEALMLQKLAVFQTGLINVTNYRNKLIKANRDKEKGRVIQKQNKRQLQIRRNMEREAMKELSQNTFQSNGQIQRLKKALRDKSDELAQLNNQLSHICQQLNEQKILYQQLLDKNIELEKQVFLLSRPKVQQDQGESFCIIDQEHYLGYMNEQMGSSLYDQPSQ